MEAEDFSKTIKDFVLYPGNLMELNSVRQFFKGRRLNSKYSIIPMETGKKFVTGMLLPTKEDLYGNNVLEAFNASGNIHLVSRLSDKAIDGFLGEVRDLGEQLLEVIANSPKMWELDIRVKARHLGADGLIHFRQYYNTDTGSMYLGVPVKIE